MIITRTWLEEFIDIEDVSNQRLYEIFNTIGLEVDSIKKVDIPSGVVVGHVISCKKHPDADKLSVCQIDIGEGVRQIVCGAANIKDAKFVAVATVGAKLSDDFIIKPAKLRGVSSDGMVCSSTELGLPYVSDGIMQLDESIGILDVGRELNEYPKIADTIIELELTANRGDCLSVHGVARDLGAVLLKDITPLPKTTLSPLSSPIAKELVVSDNSDSDLDLIYKLAQPTDINEPLLTRLRLGYVGYETTDALADLIAYCTHATGVVLRAYDMDTLLGDKTQVTLSLEKTPEGLIHLNKGGNKLSTIGVNQADLDKANIKSKEILFEASYIHPASIIEGVALSNEQTDPIYYNTSRGYNYYVKNPQGYYHPQQFWYNTFSAFYNEASSGSGYLARVVHQGYSYNTPALEQIVINF